MSTDDRTPGQVLALRHGLHWAKLPPDVQGFYEDDAAAVLAHHAAAHQPRVWRSGDPEPGEDVRAVLDYVGVLWSALGDGTWGWIDQYDGGRAFIVARWDDLLEYVPLVEVVLPSVVTE